MSLDLLLLHLDLDSMTNQPRLETFVYGQWTNQCSWS